MSSRKSFDKSTAIAGISIQWILYASFFFVAWLIYRTVQAGSSASAPGSTLTGGSGGMGSFGAPLGGTGN
ncbi:MAG TPA: hypothetical protein VKP61_15130 [Candidatus Acidoferrum sp.]|nr:hypothetical protein [Candidatus Acidoferrum sp.]